MVAEQHGSDGRGAAAAAAPDAATSPAMWIDDKAERMRRLFGFSDGTGASRDFEHVGVGGQRAYRSRRQRVASGGGGGGRSRGGGGGASVALLTLGIVVLVLSRSIDYVLWVRLAYKMTNYEWFLSQVALTCAFLAVMWPVVWYRTYVSRTISVEHARFPKRHFAVMGAMDALGNLMSTLAAPYIAGPLQVMLSQGLIPITMLIAYVWLATRYERSHYIAAAVILVGILVAVLPSMFEDDDSGGDGDDNEESGVSTASLVFWVAVLFASNVPFSFSNTYKERSLKSFDMDLWYSNAWIAVFQLGCGVLAAPVVFLPMPAPSERIEPSDFGAYLGDSFECFFGVDSRDSDACGDTYLVFGVFIVFNITYNILLLFVVKHGSAAMATVASAVRLPLSAFGFLIPFLAGEAVRDSLSAFDVVSLVIVVAGVVIYRMREETKARGATTSFQHVPLTEQSDWESEWSGSDDDNAINTGGGGGSDPTDIDDYRD